MPEQRLRRQLHRQIRLPGNWKPSRSGWCNVVQEHGERSHVGNSSLQQAKALSPRERKELLRLLQEIVAVDDGQKPQPSLLNLAGLGKEYWQDVDVDAYLKELRDEWEREF